MREICDTYEKEPDNTDKVVELMQRMQECGQPPAEIVKELGGGVELDENGMPKGLVSGKAPINDIYKWESGLGDGDGEIAGACVAGT